jgi:hypothetical protein
MIVHQALILWRMLTAACGTKPTCRCSRHMSVVGGRADLPIERVEV